MTNQYNWNEFLSHLGDEFGTQINVRSLEDIASIVHQSIKARPIENGHNGAIAYLRRNDFSNGFDGIKAWIPADTPIHPKMRIEVGDIIYSDHYDLKTIVACAQMEGAVLGNGLIRVRADSRIIDSKFLGILFRDRRYDEWVKLQRRGTAINQGMQDSDLAKILIPIVSLELQKEAVILYESTGSDIFTIIKELLQIRSGNDAFGWLTELESILHDCETIHDADAIDLLSQIGELTDRFPHENSDNQIWMHDFIDAIGCLWGLNKLPSIACRWVALEGGLLKLNRVLSNLPSIGFEGFLRVYRCCCILQKYMLMAKDFEESHIACVKSEVKGNQATVNNSGPFLLRRLRLQFGGNVVTQLEYLDVGQSITIPMEQETRGSVEWDALDLLGRKIHGIVLPMA